MTDIKAAEWASWRFVDYSAADFGVYVETSPAEIEQLAMDLEDEAWCDGYCIVDARRFLERLQDQAVDDAVDEAFGDARKGDA